MMLKILRAVAQRAVSSLPALFGIVLLIFILMRVLPGDPAAFFASSPGTNAEEIQRIRVHLGLDQSLGMQFWLYLKDLAVGNLGESLTTGQPVAKDLLERMPASLELTFTALILALVVSVPLGIAAAVYKDSAFDHIVRLVYTIGVCTPTFVTGLLLILVFYYHLGWVPDPTGRLDVFMTPPPTRSGFFLLDALLAGDGATAYAVARQLILPAVTMAIFVIAPLARMTRASMLAVLSSEYIRMGKALGLSPARIVFVYALRNALIPVLTVTGVVFSAMLGASVLVEKVFAWPGMASYALDAFLASDYAPVQGFVLMMALIFVCVNLVIDILYRFVDPRVSLQ